MPLSIAEIVGDDHLIIESRLQGRIWDELTVQCSRVNGTRCALICRRSCRKAKMIINELLPVYFNGYARWN